MFIFVVTDTYGCLPDGKWSSSTSPTTFLNPPPNHGPLLLVYESGSGKCF
jgi:hypothetical protein